MQTKVLLTRFIDKQIYKNVPLHFIFIIYYILGLGRSFGEW